MFDTQFLTPWKNLWSWNLAIGAVMAIQDAAVLADLFYHLKSNSLEDITSAFETFREVRFPPAKRAFNTSHEMSQLIEQVRLSQRRSLLVLYPMTVINQLGQCLMLFIYINSPGSATWSDGWQITCQSFFGIWFSMDFTWISIKSPSCPKCLFADIWSPLPTRAWLRRQESFEADNTRYKP